MRDVQWRPKAATALTVMLAGNAEMYAGVIAPEAPAKPDAAFAE